MPNAKALRLLKMALRHMPADGGTVLADDRDEIDRAICELEALLANRAPLHLVRSDP